MLRLLDLRDFEQGDRLARNAWARALAEFLGDRHVEQYGRLFAQLEESR